MNADAFVTSHLWYVLELLADDTIWGPNDAPIMSEYADAELRALRAYQNDQTVPLGKPWPLPSTPNRGGVTDSMEWPEKLRLLADWFDSSQPHEPSWSDSTEVQDDLRALADWIDNLIRGAAH